MTVLNPTIETTGTKRIQELDSLRALAAISLVLFHFTHVFTVKYGYTSDLGWEWSYGKYGVQLFFLLSGFVNAMTLTRKRDSANFFVGRILRICPSYWSVIIINCLLVGIAPLAISSWSADTIAANLTIVPNLLGYQCMEPVTWTLQIEVLFYLIILGLFCTGALRNPALCVFGMLSVCSLVGVVVNQTLATQTVPAWLPVLQFFQSLFIMQFLPLFCVGILLNEVKCGRGVLWHNLLGIATSLFVFHLIDRHDHNPAASVLLVGLLTLSAYGKCPPLRVKPLVFISSISYALYLLHNNIGCVFIWHVNQAGLSPLASMLLGIVFVVLLSTVVTLYIEQPLTKFLRSGWFRLREKWESRFIPSSTVSESN